LKRLKKVEDAPAYNHIIVQTHKSTHLQNGEKKEQRVSVNILKIFKILNILSTNTEKTTAP